MKIVVLFSGRGSNLEALARNATKSMLGFETRSYEIVAAITDGYGESITLGEKSFSPPGGIQIAKLYDIPVVSYPRFRDKIGNFAETRESYQTRLSKKVLLFSPDLIVMAGFMQLLVPSFVKTFSPRLINIHPSLLPNLPGLNTHERAIAEFKRSGNSLHGASIHLVDEGMDTGQLITQASLQIGARDSPSSLAARIIALEHIIYPFTVESIARGQINLNSLTASQLVVDRGTALGIQVKI